MSAKGGKDSTIPILGCYQTQRVLGKVGRSPTGFAKLGKIIVAWSRQSGIGWDSAAGSEILVILFLASGQPSRH